jgi:hypothetical protein
LFNLSPGTLKLRQTLLQILSALRDIAIQLLNQRA